MWFGDGVSDKRTRGRAGAGRVEDVKVFTGSDEIGIQMSFRGIAWV